MENHWYTIVNPAAGGGKCARDWPEIAAHLSASSYDYEAELTEHHMHSAQIVERAIHEGHRNFICVGGDGTFHNIVNGVMRQNKVPTQDIKLSMIAVGTGNDWIRSSGVPKRYIESVAMIRSGKVIRHDIGTVIANKSTQPRYFINFAGIGFDALVVQNVKKDSRLGKFAYYISLIKSLFEYQPQVLEIETPERKWNEQCFIVLAGIGKYGGGGMKFTPGAELNDGLFDCTIIKDATKPDVIRNLPGLFSGALINHPKVDTIRCKKLSVNMKKGDVPVLLEADGELIGEGPFEIGLIEGAIQVVVPN